VTCVWSPLSSTSSYEVPFGPSGLLLLGSLLLGRFDLHLPVNLLVDLLLPRSHYLLMSLIVQSLKKGLLLVSGGRSALQTKTVIKYTKLSNNKLIINEHV
jgi:hypothetical protein